MAGERMSKNDVEHLLKLYFSERRRLMFQLERVRASIAELKRRKVLKEEKEENSAEGLPKRGPGRPPKTEGAPARRGRKPGRRKKRTTKNGGYRLNPWDLMVRESIERSGLLVKEDLLAIATEWAKRNDPKRKGKAIDIKLTQTLQKLSGKRGILGKQRTGDRRGYHYGLKDWFFKNANKLRPAYRPEEQA